MLECLTSAHGMSLKNNRKGCALIYKRKSLPLGVKLDVLDRLARGERNVDVVRATGLHEATVRTIKRNEAKIRARFESETAIDSYQLRGSEYLTGESSTFEIGARATLKEGIGDDCTTLNDASKTSSIVTFPEDRKDTQDDFEASQRWLDSFKKSEDFNTDKLRCKGAVATGEVVRAFREELLAIIADGRYHPKQVFNVKEIDLFWKKLPSQTCFSEIDNTLRFCAEKERLALLLGGNAEGDKKLKPLLIYHTENPLSLDGYNKEKLPLYWYVNSKAKCTRVVFDKWLERYLKPELEVYCREQNIELKILLLIDSDPAHDPRLEEQTEHEAIRIKFLPRDSAELIQPMNQGVIAIFKAFYMRRILQDLQSRKLNHSKLNPKEFWRQFDIKHCIDFISDAWDEISQFQMNHMWSKLWPDVMKPFRDFRSQNVVQQTIEEIVQLCESLGFASVTPEEIQEVLNSHSQKPSDQDLQGLIKYNESLRRKELEDEPRRELNVHSLREMFHKMDDLLDFMDEVDWNRERCCKVRRALKNDMRCYLDLYEQKIRKRTHSQTPNVLTRKLENEEQLLTDEPTPSISGGVEQNFTRQHFKEEDSLPFFS